MRWCLALDPKANQPDIEPTKVNFMKSGTYRMPLLAVAGVALCSSLTSAVTAQSTAVPNSSVAATQPASQPRLSFGVAEVMKLSHAKLSDDAIVAFIQNSQKLYEMSAADIVYMHEDGVTDRVITAMLEKHRKVTENAAIAVAATVPPVPSPQPAPLPTVTQPAPQVVVQSQPNYVQTVQPAPVYVYSSPAPVIYEPYPYYRPYYGYPALSLSFGFGRGYYGGYRGGFHGHHH